MSTDLYPPIQIDQIADNIPHMAETVQDRIKKLLALRKVTPQRASIEAGMSRDALRTLFRHPERNPSAKMLSGLAQAYDVSTEWLLNGGPMADEEDANCRSVPLVSFLNAGQLSEPSRRVENASSQEKIHVSGLPDGNWIALNVEEDSMNLYSPPGSIIFVNRNEQDAVDGGFYVVRTDHGEAIYKRYRSDPDRLEPESTNREHQTIFPRGPLTIIGRVRLNLFKFPS